MERPLLSRENSGAVNRRRERFNRSQAIAYGSPYEKAAALVDLAEDGIGLPEQILEQSNFQNAAKFYFIFTRLDFIWCLNYFALIILNFLEKPLWCTNYFTYSCNNREYFYLGQLPYLTGVVSLIYEAITLIILMVHTFFPLSFEGYHLYWKSLLNRVKVACLLILVADILVYALYLSPKAYDFLPFRIAPYIRVVFFMLNFRELRATIIILAGMLGTYLNVLALGLLFLLFSSWLAFVMFEDTQQGKTVFTSYGTTLYQMFVLFTTSNNPDVWIPAYKASRWHCLFFVLYVLLGVYFVTNLILAVVYDSFKSQLVKQVSEMDSTRRRVLKKAFNLIDKHNCGFIDKEQCVQLFQELNKYRTLPNISGEEFELIFDELDDSQDFKINLDEFADLCNAIALKFRKEDSPSCFEKCPFYHSPFSEKLKGYVRRPIFGYIVSFILVLNLLAVIVETTLDIENNSAQKVWQEVEFVFVIGETLIFVTPEGLAFLSNGEWIRYLLLARMLRLIRLLMHVQRYRAFIATFIALIPSLMPYLGTIFCVLCIYCSLGVQIFGGIVNDGNASLEETDLADYDYLLFNFNDYPNGMVTLFNLLVAGNWQMWMESYEELTGTSWTLAYFFSFYLVTVLLLLNLIIAFVLEAFFAEMDLESSENCNEQDKEVDGGKGRRRSVGTKSQSQRVDALLHHMLSAELDRPESSNP
ncbi:hypothetical protein F2P56_001953 [Juglans regia]|uniref:EF-hand domain-containing protein n=1 Tax=Juglans regia TaxID=51240 RepID=A0A833YBD1_JUGRE|nr:hypothetical protein F2P56_001953 [Juglans regia]